MEGVAAAALSAAVWLLADIIAGHPYSHPLIPFWNALVRFGFFIIIALLMAKLKTAFSDQAKLIVQLEEALANIRTLSGLLPMCAWCKNI